MTIVIAALALLGLTLWRVGNAAQLVEGIAVKFSTTQFDILFQEAGRKYGVDWKLLKAIGFHESRLNPNAIGKVNRNGSIDYGLMQVNDKTAQAYGVKVADLMKPEVNVEIAARLLAAVKKELGSSATLERVIAAYNAGSPAIKRRGIFNQDYVASVLKHYDKEPTA